MSISPFAASAITIPIVAALLWITAVKTIPASSRMFGASAIEAMNSWNRSLCAHEAEPATSNPIPWNTSPKPKIDRPTCLIAPDRTDRISATPIAIINGAQSTIWNEINCTVTVVPRSAPSSTPSVCRSDNNPAPTSPSSSTVIALELCISTVTPAPRAAPLKRLPVIVPSTRRRRVPATCCRASPAIRMP